MLTIKKVRAHNVIDFAAEELKEYLRMMMPEDGEIDIVYDPDAKDGFRLGLLEDFADGVLHGIAEALELHTTGAEGQIQTCAQQKHQHGNAPYEAVDDRIDMSDKFHSLPTTFLCGECGHDNMQIFLFRQHSKKSLS